MYNHLSSIPASFSAQPDSLNLPSSLAAFSPLQIDVPLDTCVPLSLGVWFLMLRSWLAGSSAGMMRFWRDSDTTCSVLVLFRECILSAPLGFDSSSPSKEHKTTSFSFLGSLGLMVFFLSLFFQSIMVTVQKWKKENARTHQEPI